MPRSKNYQVSTARIQTFPTVVQTQAADAPAAEPAVACIDMVELLGPAARFAKAERRLDLRAWLGRGIDPWVWAALTCLKAMLLSGTRETSSITTYHAELSHFFLYLTEVGRAPRVATPADLSPLHVHAFTGWLQKRGKAFGWGEGTPRTKFNSVKAVLLEMFAQGFISGEPTRFFPRSSGLPRDGESRQTSFSDGEQERIAQAIKLDLIAIHQGRLTLPQSEVQALRLVVISHRQGHNLTPLLEISRDALAPGLLPGTVRVGTSKFRNRKRRSSAGRADPNAAVAPTSIEASIVFSLAEGAVLQLAMTSTAELVKDAPERIRNRVWLYRTRGSGGGSGTKKGSVTCLTAKSTRVAIDALIKRHKLFGDDGAPLKINTSRFRKSFFDRALRTADGDLAITANLMGNMPQVAGLNYPSMNESRKAVAASFLNEEYTVLMRGGSVEGKEDRTPHRVIEVRPLRNEPGITQSELPENTPVSRCKDSLNGEHAPRDGHNHCDRYVMCLFCSSFAIVGTVEELWRLFSFQEFAKFEQLYLDKSLGPERTGDDALEDLRDRYRLAIPYIDDFTQRQFPAQRVAQARAKAKTCLHPYWEHQMKMSRRAHEPLADSETKPTVPTQLDGIGGHIDS